VDTYFKAEILKPNDKKVNKFIKLLCNVNGCGIYTFKTEQHIEESQRFGILGYNGKFYNLGNQVHTIKRNANNLTLEVIENWIKTWN
jgi:hypothetical protein